MAQSILKTGEIIEGALVRSQAFKQARQLGEAISQTNPQSDDWPQQAAFLVAQYPLAAQSGLAKQVMEPVGKAYAGYQAAKRVDNQFGNNVALENLRSRHAMDRTAANAPLPINFNTDPLAGDVTPGQQQGIPGVLQNSLFGGTDEAPPADGVLPAMGAIPDAATGMRDRSRRELMVMRDLSNENAASQRAGGPVLWNTRNQPVEINRRLTEEIKANAPAVDLVPSKTVEGVLVNPKSGTPYLPGQNGGIVRPAGQMEDDRLAQTKTAAAAVQDRAIASLQYRRAKDAESTALQDFNREDRKLDKMKKDGWDSEGSLNVGKYRDQLKVAMDAKKKAEDASTKLQSLGNETAPSGDSVTTQAQFDVLPSGSIYTGKDGKKYRKP